MSFVSWTELARIPERIEALNIPALEVEIQQVQTHIADATQQITDLEEELEGLDIVTIENNIQTVANNLATEVTRAQNAESEIEDDVNVLSSAIQTLSTDLAHEVNVLSSSIQTVSNNLAIEISRAQNAESSIENEVEALSNAVQTVAADLVNLETEIGLGVSNVLIATSLSQVSFSNSTPSVIICQFSGVFLSLPTQSGLSAGKTFTIINDHATNTNDLSVWTENGLGHINGITGPSQTIKLEYGSSVTLIAFGSGKYVIKSLEMLKPHCRITNDDLSNSMYFYTTEQSFFPVTAVRMEISHVSVATTVPVVPSAWVSGQTMMRYINTITQGTYKVAGGSTYPNINIKDLEITKNDNGDNSLEIEFTYTVKSSTDRIMVHLASTYYMFGSDNDQINMQVYEAWQTYTNDPLISTAHVWNSSGGGGGRSTALFPFTFSYVTNDPFSGHLSRKMKVVISNASGQDTLKMTNPLFVSIEQVKN